MRHIVEAGTDAAMLVLFDRAVLPDDFDARSAEDRVAVVERLDRDGRIFFVNTGRDGAYLLHAFVDETIPADLAAHLFDPLPRPFFPIPSGRVYFAGAEYCSIGIEKRLEKAAGLGGSFTLPPGTYKLTLWRAEYPDGHVEQLVAKKLPPVAYRVQQSMGWLIAAAIAGAILLGALWFVAEWSAWHFLVTLVETTLICLLFILPRLPSYKLAREMRRSVERQCPSLVARLESKDVV